MLDGVVLRDVLFRRGSLANVRALKSEWKRVQVDASRATGLQLGEARLEHVSFEGARLDFASFRHARLEHVTFRDCRLEEADFGAATLVSVTFERCPLTRASLDAATCKDVELRGCDLEGVTGAAALRGASMPLEDVIASAPTLAAGLGIRVVQG